MCVCVCVCVCTLVPYSVGKVSSQQNCSKPAMIFQLKSLTTFTNCLLVGIETVYTLLLVREILWANVCVCVCVCVCVWTKYTQTCMHTHTDNSYLTAVRMHTVIRMHSTMHSTMHLVHPNYCQITIICVSVHVCVCMYVCVCERERERESENVTHMCTVQNLRYRTSRNRLV